MSEQGSTSDGGIVVRLLGAMAGLIALGLGIAWLAQPHVARHTGLTGLGIGVVLLTLSFAPWRTEKTLATILVIAVVAIFGAIIVVGGKASGSGFCGTHTCIGDFNNENGSIVECADGTYSHAGGLSGACSWHGGVAAP